MNNNQATDLTLLAYIKQHQGTFKGSNELVREIVAEYERLYKGAGLSISKATVWRKLRTPMKNLYAEILKGRGFGLFIQATHEATGIVFSLDEIQQRE